MCSYNISHLIKDEISSFREDSFYKDSIFIFLGRALTALCGFIFWIVASHYYTPGDVGIATALISSLALIVTFSKLGFDVSIIRFMPSNDKGTIFSTCLIIISFITIIASSFFLIAVELISPKLSGIQNYPIIFVAFSLFSSIIFLTGVTFLSIKKTKYYFLQYSLDLIRIAIVIPLAFLGSLGLFISYGASTIFSMLLAAYLIKKSFNIRYKFDTGFIRSSLKLSLTNYISNIFVETPGFMVSIIILNLLGPDDLAFYFIASTIGINIFLLIPDAICKAFFVGGCHGIDLRNGLIRSLLTIYIILIPIFISIYFLGSYLLALFGMAYLEAFSLLKIFALSGFLSVIYMAIMPILNIKMLYGKNLALNSGRLLIYLVFTYILISKFGLIGIGYSWFLVEAITSLSVAYWVKKENLIG
jgi:O-antigen/teichoic acid export membrane protein